MDLFSYFFHELAPVPTFTDRRGRGRTGIMPPQNHALLELRALLALIGLIGVYVQPAQNHSASRI